MDVKVEYSVVDLFCGIGGLTRGFLDVGFQVEAGIDIDEDCRYAYEKNNNSNFVSKSVSDLSKEDLLKLYPKGKKKILIGCAPCQPFSIFNQKSDGKVSEQNSERWKLLYSFSKLIDSIRPEIVSMENVPLLKTFKNGKVLKDFIGSLKSYGYHVSAEIYDSQYYGVPQRRKRLVLLASLKGPIDMIPYTHLDQIITVKKAIGNMAKINSGDIHTKDKLHRSRKLNELNLKRIKATPEGGGWKDWDLELVADCHKKEGGKAYGSAYGRMSWNDVAPTMTTYCVGYNNGRFGHPSQDRAISLREAAILQSFPKNYDFIDPDRTFSSGRIAKQIGNAVPVGLGQAIAKSVEIHLKKFNDE